MGLVVLVFFFQVCLCGLGVELRLCHFKVTLKIV